MNRQTMIDALNSLEVTEWSAYDGELEYVLADNNEHNRKVLLEAGFTEKDLEGATGGFDDGDIDLVHLAVHYVPIHCWIKDRGFVEEEVYNEWERQKNEGTEQIL